MNDLQKAIMEFKAACPAAVAPEAMRLVEAINRHVTDMDIEMETLRHGLRLANDRADRERELLLALQAVKDMTDADNPESYRCDDREGCLDTVFAKASRAIEKHNSITANTRGQANGNGGGNE